MKKFKIKFEVGKVYESNLFNSEKIKITKRSAKTVHYQFVRYPFLSTSDDTEYKTGISKTGISICDDVDCDDLECISVKSLWSDREYIYYANNEAYVPFESEKIESEEIESGKCVRLTIYKNELEEVNAAIDNAKDSLKHYAGSVRMCYISYIAECENIIYQNGVELDYYLQKKAKALESHQLIKIDYNINVTKKSIKYYSTQIIAYSIFLAELEDYVYYYGIRIHELEEKASALENEMANRRLIEAINYVATADAVEASAEAMEKLNAVNDTAVSDTVIKPDDDAEVNTLIKESVEEYARLSAAEIELEKQIEEIERQLEDLKYQRRAVYVDKCKAEGFCHKATWQLDNWVFDNVQLNRMDDNEYTVIRGNNGDVYITDNSEFSNSGYLSIDLETGKIQLRNWRKKIDIAEFDTVKEFKAAMRGLVAAMKRGDEKYTFPTDK